jgi:5-formyltetrahydrofolate cyclo-ligase
MNSIADKKNRIRKSLLERRNRLSATEVYEKSQVIQLHVLNSSQFLDSSTVGVYFPTGTEVRTEEIIQKAIQTGKRVALPRIELEEMSFYQLYDKSFQENDLVVGKFGVKEPSNIGNQITKLDLLIVPGIVFDYKGHRIGYGRGYFDRYIMKAKVSFSLGLGYKFQLLSYCLPQSPLDQRIDGLSIETGVLKF